MFCGSNATCRLALDLNMKRCPECRKDYLDETLIYCLDDGARLVQGTVNDEPATAIMSGNTSPSPSDEVTAKTAGVENRGGENPGRNRVRVWIVAFAVMGVLALTLAVSLVRKMGTASSASSVPLRRFALTVPSKSAPNWNDFGAVISPDGSRIAYNCREANAVSICLRDFDSLSVQRLTEGREAQAWFFSPDGEWLGIVDEVGLTKVSIRGGEPQKIYRWLDNESVPKGFSWGSDGYILFGTSSGVQRVPAAGGPPEFVTKVDPATDISGHSWPAVVPGGRSVLITIDREGGGETAGLVDLRDGTVKDLGIRGHGFVFVEPRWLVFRQGTTLHARVFDPAEPDRAGTAIPVLENASSMPSVGSDGTLVYIPTRGESNARLVWVDRQGRPTAIESERLDYTHLDLAPDSRRALLNLEGRKIDLIDLQGGTRKLVAAGSFPIWTSNGERVIFTGTGGLQWAPVDGSASPEMLVTHPGFVVPTSWNAVSGDLAYYDHRGFEIWIRASDGTTRRFVGGPGRKRSGRFSPDGKWMAFVSDETGEYQVYVTAYPGPGSTVAVSTKGGLSPIWSADGGELFFRLGSKMLASKMSGTQPLGFEAPVELFDGPYTLDLMGHQREDIASDGLRFLMVENSDDFPIVIVQNWSLELERLVR
jgi:eukaryotic-like serine/threonine-protein kinase